MPHIIVIQGALGAGKTTMGAILAHYYKNKVTAKGGTLELFSNCEIALSKPMKHHKDWYQVAEAHGSLCIWDEAHRIMDSRTALKGNNILATHILTYARKMASIQVFISPSILNLDSRLRQLTEVLINVRKSKAGITYDYFDYQDQFSGPYGRYLHSRFLPAGKLKQVYALNLFDSHAMVGGFPMPGTDRETDKFLAELEKRHDLARFGKTNVINVDQETGEILQ